MKHIHFFIISSLLVLAGCTNGKSIQPYVNYTPPFIPITFNITESGVQLESGYSFVTFLGTFEIGANTSLLSLEKSPQIIEYRNETITIARVSPHSADEVRALHNEICEDVDKSETESTLTTEKARPNTPDEVRQLHCIPQTETHSEDIIEATTTTNYLENIFSIEEDDVFLILQNNSDKTEEIYKVSNGEKASIIIDGLAEIEISGNLIFINITQASIIELRLPK